MPAKIIETNKSKLKTVDVDGVTVDIIENALRNYSALLIRRLPIRSI